MKIWRKDRVQVSFTEKVMVRKGLELRIGKDNGLKRGRKGGGVTV